MRTQNCTFGDKSVELDNVLDKFEILPAFSKPIAWVNLKLSDEFYKNIDIAFDQSNIEMVHNDGAGSTFGISEDMHVLNNPVLKDFKKIILNTVKNYWHNELRIKNDFSITTSWFTLLTNGTKGDWHSHANNFLSGFKAYDDGGEVIISSNVDKSLL